MKNQNSQKGFCAITSIIIIALLLVVIYLLVMKN